MSVGIVLVSHSALIAHGLVDLARQMAPTVAIVPAGGSGDGTRDDAGIGTSFDVVSAALAEAEGGDGVVVLADLGSAYLTAETAVDLLDEDAARRVVVVRSPLVEGAVAAGSTATACTPGRPPTSSRGRPPTPRPSPSTARTPRRCSASWPSA